MSQHEKVNILMVDDQPENLVALEAVLETLDQELVKANSGGDALRQLLEVVSAWRRAGARYESGWNIASRVEGRW